MILWFLQLVGFITVGCFIYAAGAESEKQKQTKSEKCTDT